MLSAIRSVVQSPASGFVVILLIASFALWGVNDVFGSRGDAIATVGSERVTVYELSRDFGRAIEQERLTTPGITQEQARESGLGEQVFNQLVLNAMIRAQARELGLSASDDAVRSEISSYEAFQDPVTGGFDRLSYRNFLAQSNQREAAFEQEIRQSLIVQQITGPLFEELAIPSVYGDLLINFSQEVRDLEALVLSPAAAGNIEEPTDEQLQQTIDERPDFFTTAERRAFTLIRLRLEDYIGDVEVAEEDVVAQYEYTVEAGLIGTPASRTYTQIRFSDEASALVAAERLEAGEAASAVATDLGGDTPSRQEDRQAYQVPDTTLRDVLFEMTTGEATAVETRLGGWFAVHVEEAIEENMPTLEDQRAEIVRTLSEAEAENRLYEDLGQYEEARAAGSSIEDAAVAAGLPIEVFTAVDPQGRNSAGQFALGFFSAPDILEAVFEQPLMIDTELLEYGDGNFFAVRVDDVVEAEIRPLDEARDDAQTLWRLRQVDERLEELADDILELLENGETFESIVAANEGIRIEQASLNRNQTAATFGQQVVNLAFAMEVGETEATRTADGRSHLVIRVNAAREGEPLPPEAQGQVAQFLNDGLQRDIDSALVAALYREFDFGPDDVNLELRDQALGVFDPNQQQSPF